METKNKEHKVAKKKDKLKAVAFFLVYPSWQNELTLEDRKKKMAEMADGFNQTTTNWSDVYGESVEALNHISSDEVRQLIIELAQ